MFLFFCRWCISNNWRGCNNIFIYSVEGFLLEYFRCKYLFLFSFAPFSTQKRPFPLDSQERLAAKRQKLTDQRQQHQSAANGLVNNCRVRDTAAVTFDPSHNTCTEPQRTGGIPGAHCGLNVAHGDFPFLHSTPVGHISETQEQDPTVNKLQTPQSDSNCTQQQLNNNQHRKKKSKKHKEKEQDRFKSDKEAEWLQSSPDLKQNPDKLDSKPPPFLLLFSVYLSCKWLRFWILFFSLLAASTWHSFLFGLSVTLIATYSSADVCLSCCCCCN